MRRYPAFTAFAILTAAVALPVGAQAQGAREAGNIVGGVSATAAGGGDNMTITYSTGGDGAGGLRAQSGWAARVLGNDGDGPQVGYLGARPAGGGRHARLAGGGDNAQVTYPNE